MTLHLGVENVVHRNIAESPGVAELNKNKTLDNAFRACCDPVARLLAAAIDVARDHFSDGVGAAD
jgi:hypothetical protein